MSRRPSSTAISFGTYSQPLQTASVPASSGFYNSPNIPWQYTLNAGVFYSFQNYTARLMIYNLANRLNWVNDNPFYGNDFITRAARPAVSI